MKRYALLLAIMLQAASGLFTAALADTPKNIGPEVINLKMGVMILPFQHRKHQINQNNECFHCHKADKWRIEGWGKEVAHQICISCHDLNEKGPVECHQCHKK